jgi:hypothetical protein
LLVKKNSTLPLLSRSYSVFKVPYEHAVSWRLSSP